VDLARERAVRGVRADEAHDRDLARVGQERGDVGGAAHVLRAVLGLEAEVAAEAVAEVVPVQPVGGQAAEITQVRGGTAGAARHADERGAFSPDVIGEFGPVRGVEAWHVRDAGTDAARQQPDNVPLSGERDQYAGRASSLLT